MTVGCRQCDGNILSAGESVVCINGSGCCTEVDGLWVCKGNKHIQVAADAVLHAVLCRQVLMLLSNV